MGIDFRSRVFLVAAVLSVGSLLLAGVWLSVNSVRGADRAFPGVERGIDSGEFLGISSEAAGVRLTIESVYADSALTALAVRISGREDLGDGVTVGGMVLKGSASGPVMAQGASPNSTDRRRQTWVFDPVTELDSNLSLAVESFTFASTAELEREMSGGPPATLRLIEGPWIVNVSWSGQVLPGTQYQLGNVRAPFGKGEIAVTGVLVAPSGVVVTGRLFGFSPEELTMFRLDPVRLEGSGSTTKATALRGGYGDGNAMFQVRFPPGDASVELSFAAAFPPGRPVDSPAYAGLRASLSAPSRISITEADLLPGTP
ncbi:MAG: hypothetical protein HYX53_07765 [Chloroflexi bacterium]|nr:hypothetical protein [Chloroflexota bacterium]